LYYTINTAFVVVVTRAVSATAELLVTLPFECTNTGKYSAI